MSDQGWRCIVSGKSQITSETEDSRKRVGKYRYSFGLDTRITRLNFNFS